jgi:DNA-binding MurR/RpiR family transcriptional regulator
MMSDLRARIDEAIDRLTPAERVVAEHLRERPDDVVLYTSTELARRTGVSKATVSRLLRSLGWAGAQDARADVRAQRARGIPVGPGEEAEPETVNLRGAAASLEEAGETRVASAVAAAPRVLVIGFRNGYPVALHLREQLAQVRPGVMLAPVAGQSLAEELVGLEAADLVIVCGFRRRPASFGALLDYLRAAPPRVLVIADPSGAEHLVGVEFGLSCPIEGAGPFDSYGAAMALVARLASGVQQALGEAGRARALAIAELYVRLGEVEPVE